MDDLYNWYNEGDNQTVQLDPNFLSKFTLSCIKTFNAESQEKKIQKLRAYGLAKASIKKWLY